jgi:hypothetical protein
LSEDEEIDKFMKTKKKFEEMAESKRIYDAAGKDDPETPSS